MFFIKSNFKLDFFIQFKKYVSCVVIFCTIFFFHALFSFSYYTCIRLNSFSIQTY